MLLLPLITMMMTSPFGLSGLGQYGASYPQVAGLNKKRSATAGDKFGNRMVDDFVDHISASIEELSRKFVPVQTHKRAKSINEPSTATQSQEQQDSSSSKKDSNNPLPSRAK